MIPKEEFDSAIKEWFEQSYAHSFPHTILKGTGYEKIKAWGTDALPLLLKVLENQKDIPVWGILFHLPSITGIDISDVTRGSGFNMMNVENSVKAWVQWGKETKIID